MPPRKAGGRWLTLTAAATEVDLSVRQLQEYAKRPGCPRKSDKKGGWLYEWPAFNRFVREELARDIRESAKPANLEEARARKMEADAAISEDDLAVRRGKLVPVEKFERALGRAYARVRSRLLPLPSRAAPDLMGLTDELQIEAILDRYVLEVIEELRTEAVPDDDDDALDEAA